MVASVVLILMAGRGTAKVISLGVYGFSLVFLFSAIAAYHLIMGDPGSQLVVRKLVHSAISLLISATYTPICINAFNSFFRWGLLTIIWVVALGGILVAILSVKAFRWPSPGVDVIMGWLCLSAVGHMSTSLSGTTLAWLCSQVE